MGKSGKDAKTFPAANYADYAGKTLVVPNANIQNLQETFSPSRLPENLTRKQGNEALAAAKEELFALQDKFYADSSRAMLIVLQGMDAAGKDGTIKHVLEGVNPQGIVVHSFKAPSTLDKSHDFLWRNEIAVPPLGMIALFNRSHYENVLVTKVHPEYLWPRTSVREPENIWEQRYQEINDWERRLTNQGTVVVKLFLNLSKEEQGRRFMSRITDQSKNWKVSPTDMVERQYWDKYIGAFTDMLNNTSTEYAPWHVLPADNKWFLRLSAVSVILEAMRRLDPQYPTVTDADRERLQVMKAQLEAGM